MWTKVRPKLEQTKVHTNSVTEPQTSKPNPNQERRIPKYTDVFWRIFILGSLISLGNFTYYPLLKLLGLPSGKIPGAVRFMIGVLWTSSFSIGVHSCVVTAIRSYDEKRVLRFYDLTETEQQSLLSSKQVRMRSSYISVAASTILLTYAMVSFTFYVKFFSSRTFVHESFTGVLIFIMHVSMIIHTTSCAAIAISRLDAIFDSFIRRTASSMKDLEMHTDAFKERSLPSGRERNMATRCFDERLSLKLDEVAEFKLWELNRDIKIREDDFETVGLWWTAKFSQQLAASINMRTASLIACASEVAAMPYNARRFQAVKHLAAEVIRLQECIEKFRKYGFNECVFSEEEKDDDSVHEEAQGVRKHVVVGVPEVVSCIEWLKTPRKSRLRMAF